VKWEWDKAGVDGMEFTNVFWKLKITTSLFILFINYGAGIALSV